MEILTGENTFADAIEMAREGIGLEGISMEENKEGLTILSDRTGGHENGKTEYGGQRVLPESKVRLANYCYLCV